MSRPSAIEVVNVSKRFGDYTALDQVDFKIFQNEFFTLLGPSGCGKTTLLKMIAGFETPSAGTLLLNGKEIAQMPAHKRRVNTVFQNYALFPHMTLSQNIAFGLKNLGWDKARITERVGRMLEMVHMEQFAARKPDQLSGGQRQRIALARALAAEPEVLLLDEPLSALDARIRKHLREQIRAIQQELGLTTIFVTHDQEEALTMSDRIFLMNQGRIVQSGDAETLYTSPVDAFAAGFIGNYNLLEAEDASRLMQRPIGSRVAIRPEAIQLSLTGLLEGEILSHSLLGNVIRYRVQAHGVELVVDVLNRSADDLHPNGQRVTLNIEASALCEVA